MTLEEMKAKRIELGLTYEQLARRSGVPVATVQKVFGGVTKSPRYTTLVALERALSASSPSTGREDVPKEGWITRQEKMPPGGTEKPCQPGECIRYAVRETPASYSALPADPAGLGKQGEYTIHDLDRLPEEKRVELIDGVLYNMGEPTSVHQLIVTQLWSAFYTCITEHSMNCIPFVAPTAVQLDEDIYTMVEPDVLVVCDRSRILRSGIFGAPDLCVEVLSPGTRSKDMNLKSEKYRKAGVREYWMVDPGKKKIIVCLFGEDPDINIYGFESVIPVGISDGVCEVDFSRIYDYVKFLMQ